MVGKSFGINLIGKKVGEGPFQKIEQCNNAGKN
jgi:hypothetical protein